MTMTTVERDDAPPRRVADNVRASTKVAPVVPAASGGHARYNGGAPSISTGTASVIGVSTATASTVTASSSASVDSGASGSCALASAEEHHEDFGEGLEVGVSAESSWTDSAELLSETSLQLEALQLEASQSISNAQHRELRKMRSYSSSDLPPLRSNDWSGSGARSGSVSRMPSGSGSGAPGGGMKRSGSLSSVNHPPRHPPRRAAADSRVAAPKKVGYVAMAKLGYQELVKAIIRPPRANSYKEALLGPEVFSYCGRTFTRRNFYIVNKRGQKLCCSHWIDATRSASNEKVPVVVYMHGNSSARLEVVPHLSYLLSLGLTVFSFDFAGSGKSDGEYVSLGYYERDDLASVVKYLRSRKTTSSIALWGRSMGAATALMHAHRDPSIACMVCDSAFTDLARLAQEMVERGKEKGVNVPPFIVSIALRMIRSSVKKQADFDIRELTPIAHAEKCFVPALFVHGRSDQFIRKAHSENLHERYGGDKSLVIVNGDHNTPRPRSMFDAAGRFLQACLQIPPEWSLPPPPASKDLRCPPWNYAGALDGIDHEAVMGRLEVGNAAKEDEKKVFCEVHGATEASGSRAQDEGPNRPEEEIEVQLETGMTIERQEVIETSLLKMMGQQEGNREGSASRAQRARPPSPMSPSRLREQTSRCEGPR